jgi:hypothetical protein
MNAPATQGGLPSIIERAAADPTFDLDKLQRLLDMREAEEIRNADKAFAASHTAAEAEMETINANARNDQTRSRYATFAQGDRDVRPIYTRHGFNISFTTEPMGTPEMLLVVGTLSHRLGGSKRYQVPVPITTKGFKGTEMMTPIHATMSAVSYGKRNLEIMMFNLAIGEDNDGNAPRRPPAPADRPHNPNAMKPNEYTHPETGEVISLEGEHLTPGTLDWTEKDVWQTWVQRFMAHLKTSQTLDEVQQWVDLNTSRLQLLAAEKPPTAVGLNAAIDAFRKKLA